MNCPLCEKIQEQETFVTDKRDFYRCPECDLTFVHSNYHLDSDFEKGRYELHDNSIRSEGYLNFLYRLIKIVQSKTKDRTKKGLDFGSGPYPMLIELMREEGFENFVGYDPFFNKNEDALGEKYSFITVCEVIEHVSKVKETWEKLVNLLEEDGYLVVSTGFAPLNLDKWHYHRDPTHISLFSEKTLQWMGDRYDLEVEIAGKDLVVFSRKSIGEKR